LPTSFLFKAGFFFDSSTVSSLLAGLPWLRWSAGEKQRNYPLLALSFNHRRAAFYQAHAKDKGHPMIQQTEAKGLRRCRILAASTPDIYVEWLCNQHNKYHRGSGQTVCGIMQEAIKVESGWKKRCSSTLLNSHNPMYQKMYDAYVRETSPDFQQNLQLYNEAKSLAHSLEAYGVAKEFEACLGIGVGWAWWS
jgi:hypothetical protein